MQHSEIESMRETYPKWWPKSWRWTWGETPREINVEAPLHHTVFERFGLGDRTQQHGVGKSYRPSNLSSHVKLTAHYNCDSKVH